MNTVNDTERQLRGLFAETAPRQAPDHLRDAVRGRTAGVRQRPGWLARTRLGPLSLRFRVKPSPRDRLQLVAATALLAAALVGGAIIFSGGRQDAPAPTLSPTPTSSQVPTAPAPSPTPSSREAAVPAQIAIWGDWLADVGAIPEIGEPSGRIQLSLGSETSTDVSIQRPDQRFVLYSDSLTAGPGELRVRATGLAGCENDEEGRYTFGRSSDGLFLTLSLVDDACTVRASIFARTWVRSHGAATDGRRGVLNAFSPAIVVDIPEGRWAIDAMLTGNIGKPRAAEIRELSGLSLIAVKNPSALAEPCSPFNPAGELDTDAIEPTIAAFSAYLATLPGFAITTQEGVVGGYPARRLAVTTDAAAGCAGQTVAAFAANETLHVFWSVRSGDPESIWLVQVDADLYLIATRQATSAEEARILSSIQFIDELPTP